MDDIPSLVVGLSEVDAGWIGLVGGKAAGLGELIKAGERVPEGFCITTDAFISRANHLRRRQSASIAI